MLQSQILSAVPARWLSTYLPWIVASVIAVLGLLVYGWSDLMRLHIRRIWAVSSVCFTEAIRRRILWVTPPAIIGVIIVVQLSHPNDAQDAIRQAIKFCLFTSGLVVTVTAILLACTNLPREIENRVIYTIVTKPITRLEIVLGKVLGFARVSGAIILVMGLFTYGYLEVRSVSEMADVHQQLATLPAGSAARRALEHYDTAGFLSTRSMEASDDLQIYARPPEGAVRWMAGGEGEYFVVPFKLTQDQKDALSSAAELEPSGKSSVYLTTTLKIDQHEPDEEQAKQIQDMGLQRPVVAFGPALPTTGPAALPPPQVKIRLLDVLRHPIIGGSDVSDGDTVVVDKDKNASDNYVGQLRLKADQLMRVVAAGEFYVQVTGRNPAIDFGAETSPVSFVVQTGTGPVTQIAATPSEADPAKPTLPGFYSFPARRGMRLSGRSNGKGAVAVFRFKNAAVGHPTNGKVTLRMLLSVERNGDIDVTSGGYSLVTAQVVNRTTGKTFPPVDYAPELNQIRYLDIPADAVEGGNFDVLVRAQANNLWLGVQSGSVALVTANESFLVNLVKSLFLLWLMSLLVVIIALFCSTFLSWPIAVVCTLILLLGHWGVEQLGDALRPGIGHQITTDFQMRDPALLQTFSTAVESLASMLRILSNFLPDVTRFPVTEDIERGISIPISSIGGGLGVLFCFGLPLLVFSYVIMRNKEVAP